MQEDIVKNRFSRWLYGYIPALLLVLISSFTIVQLSSSIFAYSPRMELEKWNCNGKIESDVVWRSMLEKLLLAQKLNPWSAEIQMDLGKMYEWKALSGSVWSQSSKDMRDDAIYHFKQAVIRRPTWALAWVSLAQSKLLNREVDAEVFQAISNSFIFSNMKKDLQEKSLWLSIGIWKKLPTDLQSLVRNQISLMLGRDNTIGMLTRIAIRFQWFDELLGLVTKKEHLVYINTIRNRPDLQRNMLSEPKNEKFVCW